MSLIFLVFELLKLYITSIKTVLRHHYCLLLDYIFVIFLHITIQVRVGMIDNC